MTIEEYPKKVGLERMKIFGSWSGSYGGRKELDQNVDYDFLPIQIISPHMLICCYPSPVSRILVTYYEP